MATSVSPAFSRKKNRRILWAVDVFEPDHRQIMNHVVDGIRLINPDGSAKVEPVYLLSPEQLDLPVEFSPPWLQKYVPAAEAALSDQVKDLSLPGITRGKVLTQRKASVSGAIKALSDYAKSSKAELIVVGSHARQGFSRLMLGSFAESLLLMSKVPMLVVGPETFPKVIGKGDLRVERVLFPTDFSPASFKVFKKALIFAKRLGAEVTLFHTLTQPIEPVLQTGVYMMSGGWVSVPAFLGKEEERIRKLADTWLRRTARIGEGTTFKLCQRPATISDSIVEEAKTGKYDLVAMAAQSGPVATALIGSVTRQVVRSAQVPVWVART